MSRLLEQAAALIAATTVLIVALSASHEFGYFLRVGGFFQTFATASDYFTNAILWLPFAAITTIGWWNYGFLWRDPPRPRVREWKTWIMPTLLVGGPLAMFLLLPEGVLPFLPIMLVYLWFLFFDKWAPAPRVEIPLSSELRTLLKFGVPVCAALATIGYASARADMAISANKYAVFMKGTDEIRIRIPLRNFDRGILVRTRSTIASNLSCGRMSGPFQGLWKPSNQFHQFADGSELIAKALNGSRD